MATNNFHNVNAENIYAVLMGRDEPVIDEDGNETDEYEYIQPQDFEYEDLLENLRSEFKNSKDWISDDGNAHFLRSFSGTEISTLCKNKEYLGISVEIEIIPVIRSGYYQGANLDYELKFTVNGYEIEQSDVVNDWAEEAIYREEYNRGLIEINKSHLGTWLEENTVNLVKFVENIFKDYTGFKLKKVSQASNGEAFYERV